MQEQLESAAAAPPGSSRRSGMTLCPYCGVISPDSSRCPACRGLFEPLSRQASQNAMGPWYVRDAAAPFRPGCSYETLVALVERGRVHAGTVIRGPTTRQFWTPARRTPGVAHLLGVCHNCGSPASRGDAACPSCGASFLVEHDRQRLGLAPVRLLPGHATHESVVESLLPDRERIDVRPERPPLAEPAVPFTLAQPGSGLPDTDPIWLRAEIRRQRRLIGVLGLWAIVLGAAAAALFGLQVWQHVKAAGTSERNRD